MAMAVAPRLPVSSLMDMDTRTYFALKDKTRFEFCCAATTPDEFDKKVNRAFQNWRGLRPRGTDASLDEFLSGFERVRVTVDVLDRSDGPK